MASLTKGGNAPLDGTVVDVAVRWTAGASGVGEVDISAFMLTASRKVKSDAGMVFYGQRRSPDGAVEIAQLDQKAGADAVETRFEVRLAAVPADIETIAFTATIGGGSKAAFGALGGLRITAAGGDTHDFVVPLAGASEAALVVGELYRRNGVWKFRAVGQGFNGGLKPLAESMGVVVDEAPAPPPAVPPTPAPSAAPAPTPAPSPARPPSTVNLSKVTLTKAKPSIDLTKKATGYGEVRINLNWNRGSTKEPAGFFSSKPKGIDLDLACLFELADGRLGAVQALGRNFGSFGSAPFIELLGDDRTGDSVDGEWMRINGQRWSDIKRVLIYTFIYSGVPNWAATDGVISVLAPDQAPIEVRLDEGRAGAGLCAIALFENTGGQMRVNREVQYFGDAQQMDNHYRWGLSWRAGSKD